jgi:hypothetical protein
MPISDFSTPRYTWLGALSVSYHISVTLIALTLFSTDTGLSSIIGLVLALPMVRCFLHTM